MTYRAVLPIWWSFFWRATLLGGLAGGLAGGIGGLVLGAAGLAEYVRVTGQALGFLAALPVQVWALRAALNRHRLSPGTGIAETFG